jgi:hypothetical protein
MIWMSHSEFYARDRAACAEWTRKEGHTHTPFAELDQALGAGKCDGTLCFDDEVYASEDALLLAVCDTCDFEIAVARSQVDSSWRGKLLLDRSSLPEALRDKSFKVAPDNQPAVDRIQRWLEDMTWKPPLFHGPAGVGKTHLLSITGALLCRRGLRVVYRDIASLMADEREYIDKPTGVRPIKLAADAEVLILDDLGAERPTPWTREQLAWLVDQRYKGGTPLLAATNLDLAEWPERFGERTASRLGGMTEPTHFGGADHRLTTIPFEEAA